YVIVPLLALQTTPQLNASEQDTDPPATRSLWLRSDQQAARSLERGESDRAMALFRKRQDWRGVAAYSAGDYPAASEAFRQQLEKQAGGQASQAAGDYYNLGHAQARGGDLEAALESYSTALELRPEFDNAKRAKALVEKLLQQAQQEGQQQEGQQQEGQQQEGQQQGQNGEQQQDGGQQAPGQNESGQQAAQDSQPGNQDDAASSQHANAGDSEQGNTGDDAHASAAQDSQRAARDEDFSGGIDMQDEQQADQSNAGNLARTENDNEADADQQDEAMQALQAMQQEDKSNRDDSAGELGAAAQAQLNAAGASAEALQQAQLQQWLNKIEDDPGGLLRRKFQYQRQLRERAGDVVTTSEDGKIW
ncbi:MAG: hypothetical protein WBN40_02930, partial [Pseudomonadales bacterium]